MNENRPGMSFSRCTLSVSLSLESVVSESEAARLRERGNATETCGCGEEAIFEDARRRGVGRDFPCTAPVKYRGDVDLGDSVDVETLPAGASAYRRGREDRRLFLDWADVV